MSAYRLRNEQLPYTPKDAAAEPFALNSVGGETVSVFAGKAALFGARDHATSGWLPADPNFPSFDALIFTPKCIITIQATIASTHDAKLLGFEYVKDSEVYRPSGHYRRTRRWCHVFLTHCEENAETLRKQPFPLLMRKNIIIIPRYSILLGRA